MKDNEFDLLEEGDLFYVTDCQELISTPSLTIGKVSIIDKESFIYNKLYPEFKYTDDLFSYIMYKDWLDKDFIKLRLCNSSLARLMYEANGFDTGDICYSKDYLSTAIFYTCDEEKLMQFFDSVYKWNLTNSGYSYSAIYSWATYKITAKCRSKLVKVMYD